MALLGVNNILISFGGPFFLNGPDIIIRTAKS